MNQANDLKNVVNVTSGDINFDLVFNRFTDITNSDIPLPIIRNIRTDNAIDNRVRDSHCFVSASAHIPELFAKPIIVTIARWRKPEENSIQPMFGSMVVEEVNTGIVECVYHNVANMVGGYEHIKIASEQLYHSRRNVIGSANDIFIDDSAVIEIARAIIFRAHGIKRPF